MGRERGQVLAFFAILLPIILLPLAAYEINAAFVSTRAAGLQEAVAEAAEAAAQQVDVGVLRARSELALDVSMADATARQVVSQSEPGASVESVVVTGAMVTVTGSEMVTLPFNFLAARAIKLVARASARLVTGYASPSSFLALPTSTF